MSAKFIASLLAVLCALEGLFASQAQENNLYGFVDSGKMQATIQAFTNGMPGEIVDSFLGKVKEFPRRMEAQMKEQGALKLNLGITPNIIEKCIKEQEDTIRDTVTDLQMRLDGATDSIRAQTLAQLQILGNNAQRAEMKVANLASTADAQSRQLINLGRFADAARLFKDSESRVQAEATTIKNTIGQTRTALANTLRDVDSLASDYESRLDLHLNRILNRFEKCLVPL